MNRHPLAIIDGESCVIIPSVWDVPSALAAEQSGARALLLSGSALAGTSGLPDLGLVSRESIAETTAAICAAVSAPLIVDIDDGLGSPVRLGRLVEALAAAGAAGVMLEDALYPGANELCSIEVMLGRIEVVQSAGGGQVRLLARTDILGPDWPFDETKRRLERYLAHGADWVIPAFLRTHQELTTISNLAPRKAMSMPEVDGFPTIADSVNAGCCGAVVATHIALFTTLMHLYRLTMEGKTSEIFNARYNWRGLLPRFERYQRWVELSKRRR
jgi:2-methylisocitrate lyase-like PEP mutase family enzyme